MNNQESLLLANLDRLKPLLQASTPITLHHLEKAFGHNRICLMVLVLCLPFYFPISIPGISTPFGLGIAWIALRELFGHEPHLPAPLAKIHVSAHLLKKMIEGIHHFDHKSRHWICPRWPIITQSRWMPKVSACIALLCGLTLCLPLPIPFSNWIPAITLLLTFMGRLYGDGLWMVLGLGLSGLILGIGVWMADTLQALFFKVLHLAGF
jgi:hypothetical protein